MKVIVAGSRTIKSSIPVLIAIVQSRFEITELVCGMCEGPDLLARNWALNSRIPVKEMPALWRGPDGRGRLNKGAGYIRNTAMAKYAAPDGALIAVYDGTSHGTAQMIGEARRFKLKIYIHTP